MSGSSMEIMKMLKSSPPNIHSTHLVLLISTLCYWLDFEGKALVIQEVGVGGDCKKGKSNWMESDDTNKVGEYRRPRFGGSVMMSLVLDM